MLTASLAIDHAVARNYPRLMPLSLYIDETGNFDAAFSHDVAICGLLADDVVHRNLAARLRPAAEAFAPEVPWPWHAAHLNRAVMWALWHDALPKAVDADAFWREPAEQLADLVRTHAPRNWRTATDALRTGRRPDMDDVGAVEQAARAHDPAGLAALAVRQSQVLAFLDYCLTTLVEQAGSSPAVFAAEALRPEEASRADRYLALLPSAVSRAVDLAIVDPPNCGKSFELHLYVLGRHVVDPVLGTATDLHQRHLQQAAATATQVISRSRAHGATTVRVVPVEVAKFQGDVHGSFVLADRLANSAGRAFRKAAGKSHAHLATVLQHETGVPIAESATRSPLAAGQPAQSYIDHHRGCGVHPRPDAPDLSSCRPWAAEQARAWAEELA